MKLYKIDNTSLKSISHSNFKLEKDIQILIENNIDELFQIQFVKTEFTIRNFRFDTLAFNKETNSFVIIEYKKDKNFSVIDQGYTYLSLLLNNKADFVLEYNERTQSKLRKDEVDWSQSRVIFISPQFTEYQKQSINFRDVPFELWEIKFYDNGFIGLIEHKTTSEENISTILTDKIDVVSQVSREVKVYDEEYHFNKNKNRNEKVVDLYKELKERILNLTDVIVSPKGTYISFRNKRPIVDVVIYNEGLYTIINMKKGTLNDPEKLMKDVSDKGHWGNGDYSTTIYPDTDLNYVMYLISQSYKNQID